MKSFTYGIVVAMILLIVSIALATIGAVLTIFIREKLKRIISFWETKALSPDVDIADASKPFIQSSLSHNIDSVYLYHLNRSIEEPKELYPLYKVLTTINPLYEYLLSKEIEFEYLNQIIYLKYKGQRIPKSQIYVPSDPHKGDNLLARRFGYFDTPDFCINGFIKSHLSPTIN